MTAVYPAKPVGAAMALTVILTAAQTAHDHDHQNRCCRECGTHSDPHVGCILR